MSYGEDQLRIPKLKLAVQVASLGQEPRTVEVFVTAESTGIMGRRAVRDLLEQPESFFPAHDHQTDEWLLLNKQRLKWIAIVHNKTTPTALQQEALELFDRRSTVRVVFADRSKLDGEMLFSPPAHGSRVVDHLNRREPYFILYQAERVVMINKSTIVAVSEDRGDGTTGESLGAD